MTWPNKITYARMLLVPAFILAALEINTYPAFKYVTIGIFVTIAVGDALDGFVARRFNLTTRVGKFIDPLADKLIMMTACVMLTLPIWGLTGSRAPLKGEIATIIIARDALICIYVLVSFLAGERGVFEPTKLGRATTFVQMFMIATTLVGTASLFMLNYVATPLSYMAAAFTIASGMQYLYKHAKGHGAFNGADNRQHSEAADGSQPDR